ncbi:MAG: hypothetical protein HQL32_06560 [Planctomycetes bacterium]|nr:hypothetical protein [Planctomycetota bacterium]
MRHPTRQSIDKFNSLLGLNEEPGMQDWEIECSDPKRIDEFIDAYIHNTTSDDERYTLMALILGSFEEYHGTNPPDQSIWPKVRKLLLKHQSIHQDLINYYACPESKNEEEIFPITNQIRELIQ